MTIRQQYTKETRKEIMFNEEEIGFIICDEEYIEWLERYLISEKAQRELLEKLLNKVFEVKEWTI